MRITVKPDGYEFHVSATVLAIIFLKRKRLYAVTAKVDGAQWYALVHEESDAIMHTPATN